MSVHKGRSRRSKLLAFAAVLLVPFAVAGLLTWSLADPGERLQNVKAAIVNNDEPAKVNGRLAPLGRQLTAKLVGDEIGSNYDWEIASEQSAAQGVRDGSYVAVVTVPKNFSRAATSYSKGAGAAERANIEVTTSDRAGVTDQALTKQLTATATRLLGSELTTRYLDNIYLGFNKLNDQLGDSSKGTESLAGGAKQLAGGTGKLASGAEGLATGNRKLADGLSRLDGGVGQVSSGAAGLSSGLNQLRDKTSALPSQTAKLSEVAGQQDAGMQGLAKGLGGMSAGMAQLAKQCPPTAPQYCKAVAMQAAAAQKLDGGAAKLTRASGGVRTGLDALAGKSPESGGGLPALAGGVDKLADGASKLAGGAKQLKGGTAQSAGGATKLADGTDSLAGGTGKLGDGARKLSNGTGKLASGMGQAVGKLPSYGDADARDKLAKVVADPVRAEAGTGLGLGSGGAALYAVLALWLGALSTFLVARAVPARALESTRSTPLLMLRGMRLPLALGVGQGVLVTVVLGLTRDLSAGGWFGCAGLAALVAVAFTALNQALAAAWPVLGRLVSALVAVLLLATGLVSTTPPLLTGLAEVLPVGPATEGLRALLGGSGSVGAAAVALGVWALVGLAVAVAALARTRTLTPAALLPRTSPPAPHRLRPA